MCGRVISRKGNFASSFLIRLLTSIPHPPHFRGGERERERERERLREGKTLRFCSGALPSFPLPLSLQHPPTFTHGNLTTWPLATTRERDRENSHTQGWVTVHLLSPLYYTIPSHQRRHRAQSNSPQPDGTTGLFIWEKNVCFYIFLRLQVPRQVSTSC